MPSSAPDSFTAVIEISYSLLLEERPKPASQILEYALSVKSKGATDADVKMMTVNLAISYKSCGRNDDAETTLAGTDWSATTHLFRLCVAAVREDIDLVCELLPTVRMTDDIKPMAIREWPAFRWVRKNSKFIDKFEKVFSEPLNYPKIVKSASDNSPSAGHPPSPLLPSQ